MSKDHTRDIHFILPFKTFNNAGVDAASFLNYYKISISWDKWQQPFCAGVNPG